MNFPDAKKRTKVYEEEFYSIFRYPYRWLSQCNDGALARGRKQYGKYKKENMYQKQEKKNIKKS